MTHRRAKFNVGQLVYHRLFDYRGAIIDVDPIFLGTDEWYEQMAQTRPPKDKPWYRVLVHNAEHTTYVAERNLEPDDARAPIGHPLVDIMFGAFQDGYYVTRRSLN
ncbi:MAG: heat shock protein HspQ [Acidiferrobacterales bacterium]